MFILWMIKMFFFRLFSLNSTYHSIDWLNIYFFKKKYFYREQNEQKRKRKISILILRQNFMLWLPYIYIAHSTQRQLIVAAVNHLLIFLAALVIFLCRLILQLLLLLFLRKHCDKVSPINDKKNIDTLKCEKTVFFASN